jgi:NADP-dependent 3-hydroxy acid dehydrogenase YdfG
VSRILITGASAGIGRATAIELAERGHSVIATARRPETLADLPVAGRLQLDVTDADSVRAAIADAGQLDALVSNAGATIRGTVEAIPLDEYERLLQLNFLGALRVAKAVLPAFRARGRGHLVFVSSVLGRVSVPGVSAYAASKFALGATAAALAEETAHFGIHVSLIEPGPVATDGASKAARYDSPPGYSQVADAVSGIAASGIIDAAEVAAAIADTLEDHDPPLHVPVGTTAQRLIAGHRP